MTGTVYLVDDDVSIRKSLSRLFESEGMPVRSFSTPEAFFSEYDAAMPGCLLLDMAMPGVDGLQVQQEINRREWRLPVLFLSGAADVPMCATALKAGAQDFLTKPVKADLLLAAVRKAMAQDAQDRAHRDAALRVRGQIDGLTPREREVMDGVIQGLLNKQIADHLGIAEKTVKIHRGRVMEKMNVSSVAELVQKVIWV